MLEKKSDREDKAWKLYPSLSVSTCPKHDCKFPQGQWVAESRLPMPGSTPEYSSRDQELSELAGELKVMKKMSLAT